MPRTLPPTERLWTDEELAERYGLSRLTLRNWRSLGIGPRSIKIGNRALYRDSDVARFEANRERTR